MADFEARPLLQVGTIMAPNHRQVTPSDTARWSEPSGVVARGAGTLVVVNCDGQDVDYGTVEAGFVVYGQCIGVKSTGTTATPIVRFW